jgi:aromatic-L-amino-acid decarboxylase
MTTPSEFSDFSKAMVDFIINYKSNIRERRVVPNVKPGYLKELIPTEAPELSEEWPAVMDDIERVIMPGMAHWAHPNFLAFFPAATTYPPIVAEMLSGALGCIGFSWASSPVSTELEMSMMNWLGKMLSLPEEFLFSPGGSGGGCIQGSATETTMMTMLAARERAVKR